MSWLSQDVLSAVSRMRTPPEMVGLRIFEGGTAPNADGAGLVRSPDAQAGTSHGLEALAIPVDTDSPAASLAATLTA